ncbi:MAG: zf-TFIIB domain-containing protein [Patescibacteria group bacterium]
MMVCPNCKKPLDKAIFYRVEVDYCPICLGVWFEEDELREAKDSADRNLNWLDVDLWKELGKFKISKDKKLCPSCRFPLYEVNYGRSKKIAVDLCNICRGIWLERGEFKAIMDYLKKEEVYESLDNLSKNLLSEFWEIFTGPESLREEVADFLTLSKFLHYKFATRNPELTEMISKLPK